MTGRLSRRHRPCDQNGPRWKDAPPGQGPRETLHDRFIRWSRPGVFDPIFAVLAGDGPKPGRIMTGATHPKAHRTRGKSSRKRAFRRRTGRTKGGLNSKLHAVRDAHGKPLVLRLGEGEPLLDWIGREAKQAIQEKGEGGRAITRGRG